MFDLTNTDSVVLELTGLLAATGQCLGKVTGGSTWIRW